MNITTTGILASAVAVTTHLPVILLTGVMLGIGFWLAKKFTNWVDLKLTDGNSAIQAILANPYPV